MAEILAGVCVIAGSALVALKEEEKKWDNIIDDYRNMTVQINQMIQDLDEYEWNDDELDELLALSNELLSK